MRAMICGCRRGLIITSLLAVAVLTAASEGDGFQQQLERAAELNLTAPWPESQAILDRIEPELHRATPDQFATFHLLRIRNLALAGNFVEGLEHTRELLQQPIPPQHQLAALTRGANLGLLARRFEQAFDYLNQSLALEPEVNDSELTTYVYSTASEIFRTVGRLERAIEYGHRSVEVAREHQHIRAECVARLRLSVAYREASRLVEAETHYRATQERCRQAEDPVFFALAESGLGDVLRRKERFDEAEHHLNRALEKHQQSGYRPGKLEALLSLTKLYAATGRTQPAEGILSTLVKEFSNLERWDFLATAHNLLASIASEHGDHTLALEHVLGEIKARERFVDVERTRQLAYLEVEFETRFQEQELALLGEQRRISELQEMTRLQRRRLNAMIYASGGFLGIILVLLLISARRERRHYQHLSRLDSLTGLDNHTAFFNKVRLMVQEADRTGAPLVLVLADIDHFKQVNDTHGHLAGDEALRQVAEVLKRIFAAHGHVGRIGGEEFAACLPNGTIEQARELLESVRRGIRAVDLGAGGRPLTMSFGLARLLPGESLEQFRQRTDQALYEAKNTGRNTVIVASPGASVATRHGEPNP
jgi:diguanylate cyclase (GGDEF)-like protein